MVVITGVSGLVGGNLARALLRQGRRVRGLVHQDRRAVEGLEMELVHADVGEPASLERALNGAEVVYHLAASISLEMDSWEEEEAVNIQGTRNVVEACLRCGVQRLVHFSSIQSLEQEPLDAPLDESRPRITPSKKHPPYDLSKAAAEEEVRAGIGRGLDAIILIPTAIVGPYDYSPSYFGSAIIALFRGRIPALVAGGFDWVDVRDVIEAALRAEKDAPGGTTYILSGHWHSVREVANMVADLTGTRAPRLSVPIGLAYLAAPAMTMLSRFNGSRPLYTRVTLNALRSNRQISHALATRELGYQPRSFRETLADTLEWFARHGYLD